MRFTVKWHEALYLVHVLIFSNEQSTTIEHRQYQIAELGSLRLETYGCHCVRDVNNWVWINKTCQLYRLVTFTILHTDPPAAMTAGHATSPVHWASRAVYVTAYVNAVVITASYTATFISFLAVRRYKLPFADFEGLLRDDSYRLGVVRGSAHTEFFRVNA
jgi:hypothetical protein